MFDPNWLQERYRFDAAARNQEIAWQCIHQFAFLNHIQIVDLGSGTGANVRHYLEQFPQNQTWFCVEEDDALKTMFWQNMVQLAEADGYAYQLSDNQIKMEKPGHWIEIHFVEGNLMQVDNLVDLLRTDLILANAVFDLFSQKQFEELIQTISHHSLSLLFTLNYEGMKFFPVEKEDAYYIDQYNAHMQRPQDFGKGMGPDASQLMEQALHASLAEVKKGESNWEIEVEDGKMLHYLLGFFEDALGDWWATEAEKMAFLGWVAHKRQLIDQQQLDAVVHHQDVLASFFPKLA